MADTRTVVLVLSPAAAEAVENGLIEARCSIGMEYGSGDPEAVEYGDLLDKVIAELQAQRRDLPPLSPDKAKDLAERMAQAGLDAVAA